MLATTSAAAAITALSTVSGTAPASAHPFGDPQVAKVESAGADGVTVRWKFGMSDDVSYLAAELGLLPEDRVFLDGAIFFEEGDPALLGSSPAFADYLLERISVTAGGGACVGEVVEIADLLVEGARVDFACPGEVGEAEVRIAMLTDLHPAYKTLVSGPAGQKAAYDGEHDTQTWIIGDGGQPAGGSDAPASETDAPAPQQMGRSAALQVGAVLAGVLALGVGGFVVVRRRRSTPSAPGSEGSAVDREVSASSRKRG